MIRRWRPSPATAAGGERTLFHGSTVVVAVPAETAFAYLSDGLKQSEWALGSWHREKIGEQLFRGTSLFDGSEAFIRISADESLAARRLRRRPFARPDAAREFGANRARPAARLSRGSCVVTLMKWRTDGQSDEVWERGCVTFDTEIHMIKGRLELGFSSQDDAGSS